MSDINQDTSNDVTQDLKKVRNNTIETIYVTGSIVINLQSVIMTVWEGPPTHAKLRIFFSSGLEHAFSDKGESKLFLDALFLYHQKLDTILDYKIAAHQSSAH